jgi:hypothetical protein
MSFKIDDVTQDICITKGDSHSITFLKDGEEYEFEEGDIATFTVKKKVDKTSDKLFQIISTPDEENHISIDILPEHTASEDVGNYWYEIELSNEDKNYVNTIIPKDPCQYTKFKICEELT